jgi:MFS family permease
MPAGLPLDDGSHAAITSQQTTDMPAGPADLGSVPAERRRPTRARVRRVHVPVRLRTFDSLSYRDFRFLWVATVCSSGAYWLQQVVIGWLTYDITRSPLLTSIVMGLDALPILLVGPLGGLLVDSFDRRRLLALVYAYQSVVAFTFVFVILMGLLETWHIFAFVALMGISWVISDPARMSLVPNMVPKEGLLNAFALNSMAFSITRMAAPALGGLLLGVIGVGLTLMLEGTLQLLAVAMALSIRLKIVPASKMRLGSALSELVLGARYVANEPVLLGLFFLGTLPSMLVVPFAHGLMPIYAAEVFGVGPSGLGLLLSAIGLGATAGTLVLASWSGLGHKGRLVLASIALMATAMLAFSLIPLFGPAFAPIVLLGGGMMMFFTLTTASIQSIVRDEYRGRVAGLYMLTWGMLPIGSLVAGGIAQRFGAPTATLLASGLVASLLVAIALRFRAVWHFS